MDHLHAVMLKTVPLCKGHKLVATPLLVAATHFLFGVAVSALYCYATRKSYFLPCHHHHHHHHHHQHHHHRMHDADLFKSRDYKLNKYRQLANELIPRILG